MRNIKAIIFDLGGVVIDWSDDIVYRKAADISGIRFKKLQKAAEDEMDSFCKGKITETEFWRRALRKSGHPKNHVLLRLDRLWYHEYRKSARLNREVIKIIRKIRARYKVGVISNISPVHDAVNKKRRYYRYTDNEVLSHKVGIIKPDLRIYRIALKKLRCEPSECLFIDDKIRNVRGARKAGMNAAQFKDAARLKRDLKRFGIEV